MLHLDSQVEQIVQTAFAISILLMQHCKKLDLPLTHGLGLVDVVSPNVDAMSPNKDGIGVRVLLHGLLEELGEVLLMRSVLDDRNAQRIVVVQVALLLVAAAEPLDLLNVVDLEDLILFGTLALQDQGHQHRPVRVGVDAAPGSALGEGGHEKGCALRGPASRRLVQVDAVLGVRLLRNREHEEVRTLHELLLHARRRDPDKIAVGTKLATVFGLA